MRHSQHKIQFQSTLSMRRATQSYNDAAAFAAKFQSTLSMRRATCGNALSQRKRRFQSTLSMRRATATHTPQCSRTNISIHALHEESDPIEAANWDSYSVISIHALHEESDRPCSRQASFTQVFQSTLSMRRATRLGRQPATMRCDFNPRSP